MKIIKGDLIELALAGKFDVIVHGCNCQCAMGAGIAKTIKNVFPEVYKVDCATEKGSREKLGTISFAELNRSDQTLYIVNAYTQFHWKGAGLKADYEAIRKSMRSIKKQFTGMCIGYPLIGAGLAGGDWSVISTIIDEELENENHTLVQFAT